MPVDALDLHRHPGLGGAALIAGSVPTWAGAVGKFTEVVVRNTPDDPAIAKIVGTTQMAGSVSVTGKPDVAVPDGVALKGTPTVKVDDTTPIRVTAPAPPAVRRFDVLLAAGHYAPGAETCDALEVPEGKRYVVDAVHIEAELLDADNKPSTTASRAYVRTIVSGNFLRFPPEWRADNLDYVGTLEGPFLADATHHLALCGQGQWAAARANVVGTIEDLN